jgi:hypothetical protein
MDWQSKYSHAKALVMSFPDSAIDFIARACDPGEVRDLVNISCKGDQQYYHEIMNSTNSDKVTELPNRRPPMDARRSNNASTMSLRDIQRLPFGLQDPTLSYPPSPALTASTSKSRPPTASTEIITVFVGSPPRSYPLSMKAGFTQVSFISEELFQDRLCDALVENCRRPGGQVSVQYDGVPSKILFAKEEVSLTWQRNSSSKTHHTTFYLVSNLDTDILIGDLDSYYGPQSSNGSSL